MNQWELQYTWTAPSAGKRGWASRCWVFLLYDWLNKCFEKPIRGRSEVKQFYLTILINKKVKNNLWHIKFIKYFRIEINM